MHTASRVDALVLGSGLAGLNFALEFAERNPTATVLVVTKSADVMESATLWAQGGIAAVMNEGDEVELHVKDTLATGGAGTAYQNGRESWRERVCTVV